MNAFDRVIGYESIKNELMQVVDVIKNTAKYKALGARVPNGILLEGKPGLGKTLMARAFVEESGLKNYEVRRTATTENFIEELNRTFEMAISHAPCIILLDDMDKFANCDEHHRNAEEYVAVQSCLDEIKDKDVYVIATINESDCLPESLIRAGRFDRKIEFESPECDDAVAIIKNYLKDKPVSEDINFEDLARMHDDWSCAELEKAMNEAAIFAGFENSECIEMKHILRATLRQIYDASDVYKKLPEEARKVAAYHEAGHALVAEMLNPGSVGIVSIANNGSHEGGFTHVCGQLDYDANLLICLAGRAASTIVSPREFAEGCASDIKRASRAIIRSYDDDGRYGLNGKSNYYDDSSEQYKASREMLVKRELERYMNDACTIIESNYGLFMALAAELIEKETLLYSDVQRIKLALSDEELVIEEREEVA